jgi:hypothetical protein
MNYASFLKILLLLQKQDLIIDTLYKNKVDLLDFVDPYHAIISELIEAIYGEDGYNWWSWYCYESDFGTKDWSKQATYTTNDKGEKVKLHEAGEFRYGATDENRNPICYSHESLWEYLENIRLNK